jgi:hypothetical protein
MKGLKAMTYKEWETLTAEEQANVPEHQLPAIPKEELENGLLMSRMVLLDGQRFWEILITDEPEAKLYPEYRLKTVSGQEIWYKFNPMWGTYSMNLTDAEPSMDEEPIGTYGTAWMKWMEEHHPHLAAHMRLKHIFLTVARSVDNSAWEYRELLENQYRKQNPPSPAITYEDNVKYNATMIYYVDSAVMRERVLQPVTEP